MPQAAFVLVLTLAPFGERSSPLLETIRVLFGPRLYEAHFTLLENDQGGGQDIVSVSIGFELMPLQSLRLPAFKDSWVTKTPDGDVNTERAVTFRARRLFFGMFLVTLRIETRTEEPGKKSSSTTRSTWIRILHVGRRISVDLGKNPKTGNRRAWEVAIEGGIPQSR